MTVNIYSLPGWLYQTIYLGLTLGLEGTRVKLPGLRQLGLQRGQTILDWGCGTGLLLRDIADELQAGTIIAMDRSPGLLRQAKSKRLPRFEGRCWFVVCDGCSSSCFSQAFDAVVASYTLGILTPEECERAIEEIHAILRPGGRLLIIDQFRPQATGLIKNAYYNTRACIAKRWFQQRFLGSPLQLGRWKFEELAYQEHPSQMSFFWVGRKA
jgi:ubiquinone/menaquinone biosynthesis C-methylase UbiE